MFCSIASAEGDNLGSAARNATGMTRPHGSTSAAHSLEDRYHARELTTSLCCICLFSQSSAWKLRSRFLT
ncbi:hypothetical protein SKAU_G00267490 [Synaphobranchus kaupii]|uniref:Uncharacterized protein n=1 Tax=Synaphobranchus kaupii TaxID=118154 RepID=A0A9Q1EZK7_SYNKA|nr:hypothetical protein SKAU_G00267490 [Synaphobranchus kaupii]